METRENMYCRFCAELKTADKLLNLDFDEGKHTEITIKLKFLKANYVNVSNANTLPKTVCFVCYDSLNKAYEFLDKVKKSQSVLSKILTKQNEGAAVHSPDFESASELDHEDFMQDDMQGMSKCDLSTERTPFDDFFLSQECSKDNESLPDLNLQVKIEPKEECFNSNILDETEANLDDQNIDNQALQVLLDATLKQPFRSDVKIYAKEVGSSKKNIKSWTEYTYICMYCSVEFDSIDNLRSHSKQMHGKCYAFKCLDCEKLRKNYGFTAFMNHVVNKHHTNLRNQCYYCNTKVEDGEFKDHIKSHFTKSQTPCSACGEILRNDEHQLLHMQKYAVKEKRKPRRKPGTPITAEDLTCPICKKLYKNTNSLRDHIKRHTIDRKRNYTCDRCGKTFFSKGTLTSHIMSHDKVRPHTCMICKKSFLFPNMLRRHVEMHTGVKPFPCDQCGRRFRLQYQLKAHKIIHTDIMPYVCQYCSKSFRFKQILKSHERQHTGVKPYSCQYCGMEFSNWSNYNKHMKRRHGTDTSKKKITPEGVFPVNPQTGEIIQVQDQGTEEWKSRIMVPAKRGKKKVIKEEDIGT